MKPVNYRLAVGVIGVAIFGLMIFVGKVLGVPFYEDDYIFFAMVIGIAIISGIFSKHFSKDYNRNDNDDKKFMVIFSIEIILILLLHFL